MPRAREIGEGKVHARQAQEDYSLRSEADPQIAVRNECLEEET